MTPEQALAAFNAALPDKAPKVHGHDTPPILFICGAPRSGTTLAYQTLVHGGDLGCVTNLVARFMANPALGVRLAQALDLPSVYTGRSDYGRTFGLSEPHEFGRGWQSWLDVADLVQPVDPPAITAATLGQITAFARAWDKPVVFKSFAYLWFIDQLSTLLPGSLWLHVSRDVDSNAVSLEGLYQSREAGTENAAWQSAVCQHTVLHHSGKPLAERCRQQVADIDAHIVAQLGKLPDQRRLSVRYEDYAAAPAAVTQMILTHFGLPRHARNLAEIA